MTIKNLLTFLTFFSSTSLAFCNEQITNENIKAAIAELPAVTNEDVKAAIAEFPAVSTSRKLEAEMETSTIDPFKTSPNIDKFSTTETIHLDKVKFDKNRMLVAMKKWGQVKINLHVTSTKSEKKWTDECKIKLYIGFNDCRDDGKMLLFKSYCDVATLPINQNQSILFFLPGDIRKRYNLARVPDYCAVRFTSNGVNQKMKIINKDGDEMCNLDAEPFHKEMKKKSFIAINILRNVDQLPSYSDIRISDHPTLLVDID